MNKPSDVKSGKLAGGGADAPSLHPALPRRLGADHGENASRPRKHHNNFKQSEDIREDRGIRQFKTNPKGKH